jgi:hypothetical protein
MVVRNEENVILDSVGHLLRNVNVERLYVIDNGSTDATPELLRQAARVDSRLTWRSEPGAYRQDALMTDLARQAHQDGAHWILPSDADEFFDPGPHRADAVLSRAGVGAFVVELRNFVQCRLAQNLLGRRRGMREIETMIFSAGTQGSSEDARAMVESRAQPYVQATYPPKHIFRAAASLYLHRGCHSALGIAGSVVPLPGSALLHAPVRSFEHLLQRLCHAERLGDVVSDPNAGWHIRRLVSFSRDELMAEWLSNSTALGRMKLPGLRLDWRLRRIARGLAGFRAEVMRHQPVPCVVQPARSRAAA